MASGKILKAAAAYGTNTARGSHFTSGHDHQLTMAMGGNKSTTVVGINTNSVLIQFQQVGKRIGNTSGVLFTSQLDCTAITSLALTSGKLTYSRNLTTCLMLVSWDQPDA